MKIKRIQEDVFIIDQLFAKIQGKIVISNQRSLIEIHCRNGQLVQNTKGLSIFCSLLSNWMRLIDGNETMQGSEPRFIFSLSRSLFKQNHSKSNIHNISNSTTIAIFSLIFMGLWVVVCIKLTYQKSDVNYTVIEMNEWTILNWKKLIVIQTQTKVP